MGDAANFVSVGALLTFFSTVKIVFGRDVPKDKKKKKKWMAQRDSIQRRMKPGRPGTPRYQRFLNRCFLLELEYEVTGQRAMSDCEETECEAGFVNVYGRGAVGDVLTDLEETFFTQISSSEDARLKWAPFVCVDVDDEDAMMASMGSSYPSPHQAGIISPPRPHGLANKFWDPLKRGARNAGFWDFLCQLEVCVEHFMHVIGAGGEIISFFAGVNGYLGNLTLVNRLD
jgi:hypothetical protein